MLSMTHREAAIFDDVYYSQVITYARKACIVYHEFEDLKTIFFSLLLHCLHKSGYFGHLL